MAWRRRRVAIAAVAALPLMLGGWAVLVEPARRVTRVSRLAVDGWPRGLDGLRLAALADLHVGAPHMGLPELRDVVAQVNGARPDLVVLLGDYVIHGVLGGRFVAPEPIAAELGRLRAPLGVVAVLGNHDWWFDGPRVRRAFEAAGLRVLDDETVRLDRGGTPLWLAGLADAWTRDADVPGTLHRIPPGEAIVALTHNPDLFPRVPRRVALTLAGHTHGGQVRLPLLGAPIVPSRFGQRYAAGHVIEDGRHLFVTTGLGTSILPLRLGVTPEVALLTLGTAPSPASAAAAGR